MAAIMNADPMIRRFGTGGTLTALNLSAAINTPALDNLPGVLALCLAGRPSNISYGFLTPSLSTLNSALAAPPHRRGRPHGRGKHRE